MDLLRRLSLSAGTTPHMFGSRRFHMDAWSGKSSKLAIGGLIIAIALFTAAMSYAVHVGAPVSLECKYYYDEPGGGGNSASTSCDSRGLPIVPSNPQGTVTGCAVSSGGSECQFSCGSDPRSWCGLFESNPVEPEPTEPPPPTPTPTPTPSPIPTPTPEPTPTHSPIPTPTPEPTPTPLRTPTPPPTPTPNPTPTPVSTPTPSLRPTPTPNPTPIPPTPTPSPTPTPTPIPTPTPELRAVPTVALIAEPTVETGGTVSDDTAATPTPAPAAAAATGAASTPTAEPPAQPAQRSLQRLAAPVISNTVPRIRNTLGGIASTPRRRMTLMIIQALASAFAITVFGYLVLRRR